MARKIQVEILGDSRSLERAFSRSERSARGFERSMERVGRGTTAAALGFRGLGRSVGFASAAFLGGAGITAALTSTVRAAEEAQVAQAQLGQALKNVGQNTDQNRRAIEKRTQALSQMSGFDDELATNTFGRLVRATGDVNKALNLNALAADVARGRGISLESATQLVTKALMGQAGALRRVGINVDKNATSAELLDALQRKFAGSARAYGDTAAGAQDRFRVALENTQEIIGNALLPSITTLLNKATAWLNDTKNQKRIQADLNETIKVTSDVMRGLGDSIGFVKSAWDKLPDFGKDKGLWELVHGKDLLHGALPVFFRESDQAAKGFTTTLGQLTAAWQKFAFISSAAAPKPFEFPSVQGLLTHPMGRGLTPQEQTALGLAGSPDNEALLRTQRAQQQRRLDFATKQIRGRMGNTRKMFDAAKDATTQIRQINDRLAAINADRARAAAAQSEKAKAARKKEADRIREQTQAAAEAKRLKSERDLGWLEFAIERAGATKTIRDDLRTNRALEKWLKEKIRREGRTLELARQLWATRQRIRDLNKSKATSDPLAGLMQVSTKRLTAMLAAGTGLGAAGRRRLGANIAGAEIRPIHVHTYLDGREVSSTVNRHNARGSNRTASQTSGRRG